MTGEQHIHIIKSKKNVGVGLIVPTFSLGQLTLSLYVLPVQAGREKQPSEPSHPTTSQIYRAPSSTQHSA